jgi:hypothetical protein
VPQIVIGQDRLQPTMLAMRIALEASMTAYGCAQFLHHNAA